VSDKEHPISKLQDFILMLKKWKERNSELFYTPKNHCDGVPKQNFLLPLKAENQFFLIHKNVKNQENEFDI